ncbi:hypothetical protein PC116_g33724 [Phytophthora cactorum]|nr:hypothetical protein PC116_g33724 [Phytophthora cactorum]
MGRNENKKGKEVSQKILWQKEKTEQLLKQNNLKRFQPGSNIKSRL